MAGSNGVAAKQAILTGLKAAYVTAGEATVQVDYVWPGRAAERECVYGGKVHVDHEYQAFKGPVRMPRLETATIGWTVEVRHMDSDAAAADQRALDLGKVLEEFLAGDPKLGGVVLDAAITSADLDDVIDDDALTSVLTYEITVRSRLD